MLESNVHYLHQFPQVQEDAVDLDNKSYDGVRNELILGNTIRQATNHLQYSYTHTHIQYYTPSNQPPAVFIHTHN